MYSLTVWTEGGGIGKTTITTSLAREFADAGLNTLVFDFDGQKGGLTANFGLLDSRETSSGDTVVDFLADNASDPFEELIQTREGVDIVPNHRLVRDLENEIKLRGGPRQREVPDEQLRRFIEEEELYKDYDILLVDVPKKVESANTRNALFATRNVLIPMELDFKSQVGVDGIIETLHRYEERKQIDVGVLGVVFNKVRANRTETKQSRAELEQHRKAYREKAGRTVPVSPIAIGNREALVKESMRSGRSLQQCIEDDERPADRNIQTRKKLPKLADWVLYQVSGGEDGEVPEKCELTKTLEEKLKERMKNEQEEEMEAES